MNCQRAEDLFIEYLYGELEPHQAESMRAHLDRCGTCAARMAKLARVRKLAAAAPDPEPSRLAINRVIARAREEAERPRSLWTFTWIKVLAPLCLAVVVGGLVAYQFRIGLGPRRTVQAPPTEEQLQVVPKTAPSLETVKKAPSPPTGEREKLTLPAPSTVAPPQPFLREKKEPAPPVPAPRPPFPQLARQQETPKTSPAAEEARAKAMDVASAPAGEQVAAGAGAPTPAGDSAASETAAPQAFTHPGGKAPPAGLLSAEKKRADQPSLGATQAPIRAAAPRQIEAAAGKAPAPTGEKPDESVSGLLATGEKALEATRYAEAGQVFTKALNLLLPGHPDRPRALLGLARAQEGQGNLAGALRTYGELAKESPAHRELAEGKIRELSGPEVK